EKGRGYCVIHRENIASWAFSAAVTSEEIDIGVETAEGYKNKGLGKTVANQMIKYTLEQNKLPVWACHCTNAGSNRMAQSLGFVISHQCYFIKSK
ncbi:MAG: GNAT family N-acetyltransferase, partial [Clostridia bacterium]|nr:GNAT family N-acetyltransferase [Clostridia bacterium]